MPETQLEPKATKVGEIMQHNSHFVIQSHSRSSISVQTESQYATSYMWVMVTYLPSCTISRCGGLQVQFSLSTGGCLSLTHLLRWTLKYRIAKFGLEKLDTLPYCMVPRNVDILNRLCVIPKRDGQTDRQADRHCESKCHASLCCVAKNCFSLLLTGEWLLF